MRSAALTTTHRRNLVEAERLLTRSLSFVAERQRWCMKTGSADDTGPQEVALRSTLAQVYIPAG